MSRRSNAATSRNEHAGVGTPPVPGTEALSYEPKTALGRKLWELRKQIVASGEKLLSWEEIEREVAERRGGAPDPVVTFAWKDQP